MVQVPYCKFVFFPPRFLEWDIFLIAPFPDRCLFVPFQRMVKVQNADFQSETSSVRFDILYNFNRALQIMFFLWSFGIGENSENYTRITHP